MKAILAILAFGVISLAATGSAAAQPGYSYYYDDDDMPPPPRIVVRPYRQPYYYDDYSYRYPAVRGYGDRSPVARGNIRGCSVDLGYGRYESCDK